MSHQVIVTTDEQLKTIISEAVSAAMSQSGMAKSSVVKKMLSPEEVASIYGFKVNTLANWRVAKKGPAYVKEGSGRIAYTVDAIEEYINANTKKTSVRNVKPSHQ